MSKGDLEHRVEMDRAVRGRFYAQNFDAQNKDIDPWRVTVTSGTLRNTTPLKLAPPIATGKNQ